MSATTLTIDDKDFEVLQYLDVYEKTDKPIKRIIRDSMKVSQVWIDRRLKKLEIYGLVMRSLTSVVEADGRYYPRYLVTPAGMKAMEMFTIIVKS